ncbi:response regulator [Azospirillum sp. SYSU D00513]|uniref:response regulator n=1 Tax=Azospirillum sp. SYSU D00513 TaxID=2812561 RepID=UPI001A974ECC|nr:response regulator [Azospirillum sp. SYSU D00513]
MTEPASLLVVEDDHLVALSMEDALSELGIGVIGPVATVAEAMERIREGGFVGALLDINLCGERVDAVADALSRKGVPFIFSSGLGIDNVPPAHRGSPFLYKPYRTSELSLAIAEHILLRHQGSHPAP